MIHYPNGSKGDDAGGSEVATRLPRPWIFGVLPVWTGDSLKLKNRQKC